ncbi:DUF3850 domain-containing protein [Lacticaseibacillus baoqingensis]|uniref:DUF3850 domain-containing protein n=1 Tax=Lacticaseibacillus baoqingensis TaxID=2486013 RepID=A0ABW4E665_9LACO|nr:DUF3850 domain-containing protein [Lacticaseibacillus baoqingensis]
MSKKIDLKIMPEYFDPVARRVKTFEIRKNDRDYQVGDVLRLREFDGVSYTGRLVRVIVTYITDYAQRDGYVVMSIRRKETRDETN